MQKKLLFLSSVLSLILFVVLYTYLSTEPARANKIREEAARQQIEDFTESYFRFAEKVRLDTGSGKMSVSVSFLPEVGSFPVKEEIYQSVAYHALQIVTFFPDVRHFDYTVLWDDDSKQEVLALAIDEEAIKRLTMAYDEGCRNLNDGFEPSFHK
ncbi:MAG: hypothetical protein LBQ15_02250, partial [Clostridium sp.]|nr:hypothetical protein [Clostridium sp.]